MPEDQSNAVTILQDVTETKIDYKRIGLLVSYAEYTYKLLIKMITNRLSYKLNSYQPQRQPVLENIIVPTTDHSQTICNVIEKQKYNIDLYLAFIDYNKALDSVEILVIMQNRRINSRYIFKNIYREAPSTSMNSKIA